MKKLFAITLTLLIVSCQSPTVPLFTDTMNKSAQTGPLKEGQLPGAEPFSSALMKQLQEMRNSRGADYKPRTRHLRPDGWASYMNRLFLESSPYLLQHAHNPVNWYPWGDDVFETAKKLNRPVLLSVGYSTCHWCHVMEEESFEDEEIARYMNENYLAIKVDREERPDLDAIYMNAVLAITGSGGWPMTVWLTPDRKPYSGGTYFPPRDGDRGARIGLLTRLKRLKEVYQMQPEKVATSSNKLAALINENLSSKKIGSELPSAQVLSDAVQNYKRRFDEKDGGLNAVPKFPNHTPTRLLLRYYRRTGNRNVFEIISKTLTKTASGGIYDHVGGGFHRYSTDKHWLVPHFEKMLYDNALLVIAYLEAYQVAGNSEYKRIANETLRYIERDMTSPDGAFYSATDADSPTPTGRREEEYFFTWDFWELSKILGKEKMNVFERYFFLKKEENFEGRIILHTHTTSAQVAKKLGLPEEKIRTLLEESKELLYQERSKRPPPLRDEKILTSWNGLMISAYAQAGLILGNSGYINRALKAAQLICDKLYVDGRLSRSYKDGQAKYNAYLDDYAFLTAGLLDLYEATSDPQWLQKAIELDRVLATFYEDKKNGGFFMTSSDHETLLAREKPNHDGAEPSGNSVAILNLYRLNEFTTDDSYRRRADKALIAFSAILNSRPNALSEMLLALDFRLDKPKEIVIVTPAGKKGDAEMFLAEFRKKYLPNRILVVSEEGAELERHTKLVPLLKSKFARNGKTTAYVCEKGPVSYRRTTRKHFSSKLAELTTCTTNRLQVRSGNQAAKGFLCFCVPRFVTAGPYREHPSRRYRTGHGSLMDSWVATGRDNDHRFSSLYDHRSTSRSSL